MRVTVQDAVDLLALADPDEPCRFSGRSFRLACLLRDVGLLACSTSAPQTWKRTEMGEAFLNASAEEVVAKVVRPT